MHLKTILLTRPPGANKSLADLFRADGLLPVVRPLIELAEKPVDQEMKRIALDLDRYDKIIFVSKSSVRFGLPILENYWPQWPQALSWFAVGPRTAHYLKIEDLEVYSPSLASSEGLLAMNELQAPMGKKVLIVRGVGGRETLKEGLEGRGALVDYAEVYRRDLIDYESAEWLPSGEKVFALVHSGEALIHLSKLLGSLLTQYCLIVPSRRLQLMAIDEGFGKVSYPHLMLPTT